MDMLLMDAPSIRLLVRRLNPTAALPCYGRPGDAGLDLFSAEQCDLAPGTRHAFGTGIAVAVPEGYVGLVWDRSGLAVRAGLTTLGGVIDATYRGEVRVPLLNTGNEPYTVNVGDRIGQLLIQALPRVEIVEVDTLDATNRGSAGFGSSGR
jgi:dUTP pyrophosphatase